MPVSSKLLCLPVVFAATATLVAGVGVTSASASLNYATCGSSSVVEVVSSPGGDIRYTCFSGLGNIDPNLATVDTVYAGEYDTYTEVHNSSGYLPKWVSPGTRAAVGPGTLVDLFTEPS